MKKLFSILLLMCALVLNAQFQSFNTQVKLGNVADGPTAEYVLVRGSDMIIKKVLKSSLGGSTPSLEAVSAVGSTTTNSLFSTGSSGFTATENSSNNSISVRGDGLYFIPDGSEYITRIVNGTGSSSLTTLALPTSSGKLALTTDVPTLQAVTTVGDVSTNLVHLDGGLDMSGGTYLVSLDRNNALQINGTETEAGSMNSEEVYFSNSILGRSSKFGCSIGGIQLNSPLSQFEVSDYLGGSGLLTFQTHGDGFEFPSDYLVGVSANVESGFFGTASDGVSTVDFVYGGGSGATVSSYSGGARTSTTTLAPLGFGIETNNYNAWIKSDNLTADRNLQAPNESGTLAVQKYKVYTALLTQSGTSAPTATVLENTLGGAVSWSYTSTGNYVATLTGAFTAGKTSVVVGGSTTGATAAYPINVNSLALNTSDFTSISVNGVLNNATFFEVRVYN